jgi:hypothetical protein
MDAHGIEIREKVAASRKLGRDDAARLVESASKVVVARGNAVTEFPGGKADDAVIDAMLGPTGNLRAPTVRYGKTLVVGFNEDVYGRILG